METSDLSTLRARLEEEEASYRSLLDSLDALARFPIPGESPSTLGDQLSKLNTLWEHPDAAQDSGWASPIRTQARTALAPTLARQQEFNAALVKLLNERIGATEQLHARIREVVATLIRYLQRILPLVDARDRMASALATSRSELILESFDRRLESLGRRLEGLLALRDSLGVLSEEVRALRAGLTSPPPPAAAAAASRAAEDSLYVAFENRFRGDRDEVRLRLEGYAKLFEGLAPIVDLGCGRGEFLEILNEQRVDALGIEGNAHLAQQCRARGLEVLHGDLLGFIQASEAGSFGGIFASQVAEHLPPKALERLLKESHRVLRRGGLLILETVNTRSLLAFLEIYNRDLTHERPLHPDTLGFLAAAAGFGDVRIEWRSPVSPADKLQPVPVSGLPEKAASALNENIQKLNALLYGPQEYALIARR